MEENRRDFEERLSKFEDEYDELQTLLGYDEIIADNKLYTFYLKRSQKIEKIVLKFKEYKKLLKEIDENENLFDLENDANLKFEIKQNISSLKIKVEEKFNELKLILADATMLENQKIIIEISSKTENEKFENLIDMFKNFADNNNYNFRFLKRENQNVVIELFGVGVYEKLKDFSGQVKFVHRGHNYFANLVVLNINYEKPKFDEKDVVVQTYKSSGAGGQHINKTESAVRLIHIPSGISIECQDERSQTKNKTRAFELLKQKIENNYALKYEKDIENQRKKLKSAIFSSTASLVLDFDKNIVVLNKTKNQAKLGDVIGGKLELLF